MGLPNVLSSGIAVGGTAGTTPCYMEVIIDTTGADAIYVAAAGGAAHPVGDTFTSVPDETWTEIPGYPTPGDNHSGSTCQSRHFICTSPVTNAAHAFRMTTVNCGQLHGSIAVVAMKGVKQTSPFSAQIWGGATPPAPLAASLSAAVGIAISALIIGFDDGNTGSNKGTPDAGWITLQRSNSVSVGGAESVVGLNIAYRLIAVPATTAVAWSYPGTVVTGLGGGIFGFLAADTPAPVAQPYVTRRLRRFPLPYDRSFWIFLRRIEFLIQAGVGVRAQTAQGYNPILQVRFSPNGGSTWGRWVQLSLGKQGDFDLRPVIEQVGRMRNGLCEVVVTDPVVANLLDCYVDADENVT